MQYTELIVVCVIAGVFGGMGMGGGTVLIPAMTLLLGYSQHLSQWLNLITFIPMSLASIFIHSKNGLIEYKKIPLIVICSLVAAVPFSLIATRLNGDVLKILFGFFIIAIGLINIVKVIVDKCYFIR